MNTDIQTTEIKVMNKLFYKKILFLAAIAMIFAGCDSDKQTVPQEMKTTPPIVTQDNFPQAFTNMRFGAIVKKAGGVNKFFVEAVPSLSLIHI